MGVWSVWDSTADEDEASPYFSTLHPSSEMLLWSWTRIVWKRALCVGGERSHDGGNVGSPCIGSVGERQDHLAPISSNM